MTSFGFHASHEQIGPAALLRAVQRCEVVGFTEAMCSDHLAPWSVRQGHSGYAWSWLGAALQATSMPFGVVTAPGQRYHPAVVAQSIATLAEMFPGRFWAALGSGEAMNEHVTGDRWPAKSDRDARLRECVSIIRALLDGDEVDHRGLVTVDRARVWSLPAVQPALLGAAVSADTAKSVGEWADGLITVYQPPAELRGVIDAFRDGGGESKPVSVQIHLSWDPDEDRALAVAHDQWRSGVLATDLLWNLDTPAQFDAASALVRADEVRSCVVVSSDLGRHRQVLGELIDLGVDHVFLHHVGQDQDQFLDAFGEHVLPELTS